MVQIVLIHGVSVRKEPSPEKYKTYVAERRAAFTKYCFKDSPHAFHDPYWGGSAAELDLGGICLNTPPGTTLGFGGIGGTRNPEPANNEKRLLEAAQQDFVGILNTLAIILADESKQPVDLDLAEQIADYLVGKEGADGKISPPDWLSDPAVNSDRAFIERLEAELRSGEDSQALGLGSTLKKAAGAILGAGLNLVDGPIEKLVRAATPQIAYFLGDVFVYLKDGAKRDAIRAIITADLIKAAKNAHANDEKFVVVGHSMGANIFYDLVSDPDWVSKTDAELGFPFKPDLFLSVGTQLGLFEELNLFKNSKPGKVPYPGRLSSWWHVYNRMDVLSFAVEGIFEGVKQFSVDTKANIIDAQGAYFLSPVFQKRLRKRLQSEGVISP